MKNLKELQVWFVTGSQNLYGPEVLRQVAKNSRTIADELSRSKDIPVKVVFKPVATTPDAIHGICQEANSSPDCVGLVTWMHTFSPAKMWIRGLKELKKPWAHLHTQFNRDLPWERIDMDFMNLNQAAHGDREFGFIGSRLRLNRKVVVGHFKEKDVQEKLGTWTRAACAWHDWQGGKIARFGDNMREVAVTEGDKVEAQIRLGYSVNGYGIGELVSVLKKVSPGDVDRLAAQYDREYVVAKEARKGGRRRQALKEQARIELALRRFLEAGGFMGFTTTFEDLHGLTQLPGLAVQRLMAAGYGFGAEGDWKTAALVRAMKVMDRGLPGGSSFMEDYTYHLDPKRMRVLGAHMLEVCESIASGKPKLEVHPLSIGGKDDPARLVFDVRTGPAIMCTLVDVGNRFRMIVSEVDCTRPDRPLKKLPVARAVWVPRPNFKIAAAAWIHGGGAHHAGFSHSVTAEAMDDFATMADIECLTINRDTTIPDFRKELKWNEAYYLFRNAAR